MYPEPVEIRPGLYLGNAVSSTYYWRQRKNIGAVVRLAGGPPIHAGTQVLRIVINDDPSEDISRYFYETNRFIAENLAEGRNVLVHCQQGISRSSTIVIAFLMAFLHIGVDDAIDIVRERAPWIFPNPGFLDQLSAAESSLMRYGIGST